MRTLSRLSTAVLLLVAALCMPTAVSAQRSEARARTVSHETSARAEDHVIRIAPPAPPDVARPPRPFPGAVWTDGYYAWNGRSHVWVEGVWMRPIPGRRWSPWRWEENHGQWTLIPGGWVPSHQGF